MIPLSHLALILFLFIGYPIFTFSNSSQFNTVTMPGKRNFSSFSQQEETTKMGSVGFNRSSNKKLRRLPHVFSKVLELPFKSDADVYVEDKHEGLKFVAKSSGGVGGWGIHVVEVLPGITKVVVRRREVGSLVFSDERLDELDVWRFRLPASSRPELATAVFARGQLVVTVPKNGKGGDRRRGLEGNNSLVTVQ